MGIKKYLTLHNKKSGFTIVELLIVIVVIAVLAAITIVAYNGIQDRAHTSAAASSSTQAAKKIKVWQVDNELTTPSCSQFYTLVTNSGTGAPTGTCAFDFKDTNYQYTGYSAGAFCVTTTVVNKSYKVSDSTTPTAGGCAGHGQGGVAAITNLVLDPKATGSNWFGSNLSGSITRTYGVSWNGTTNWVRMVASTAGYSSARLYVNELDLVDGSTYTASFVVGNSGTATVTFFIDFCDVNSPVISVAPGEQKRISFSAGIADYTATYRFIDVNINQTDANGLLITSGMLTRGSTLYNYADGTSANWAWTGTANNSTSSGPPL